MVIANVFPKLETVNNFLRPLCENPRFGTRFDSKNVKVSQKLTKSPWERFFHVFSSFWGKLIWKMSTIVLGKILGVFVKTLTPDGKYPVQYCQNLQLRIQMQLSEKQKTLSQFFIQFLESTSNLKHLKKKIMVIANVFPKLQTVKDFFRPLCKTRHFGSCFDS